MQLNYVYFTLGLDVANIVIITVLKPGGIVAGASVNVLDSVNDVVASGTTTSVGTLAFDLLITASFTAEAVFVDSSGTWTGSAAFSTDPYQIISVPVNLSLH